MKRYLLFDSGCRMCTDVARSIELEAGEWLQARSLHDPEIQLLLQQQGIEWQWKPQLLEIRNGDAISYSGLSMGLRVLHKLGIHRGFRVLSMLSPKYATLTDDVVPDSSRRQFTRWSSALLVAFVTLTGFRQFRTLRGGQSVGSSGTGKHAPLENRVLESPPNAEVYEGFLILPEGAQIPDFVVPKSMSLPHRKGVTTTFDSLNALSTRLGQSVYLPKVMPENDQPSRIMAAQYENGDIFDIYLTYETPDAETDASLATRILRIAPVFYWPNPVFYTPAEHPDEIRVVVDKVSFLPSAGLRVTTVEGFVYHWFSDDLLYTFVVDPSVSVHYADELAASFAL